ncbi:Mis12 domain-containing protein [Trichoderma austrokoningii]
MAATSSDYELLTEHFSYPPVSLLDDIINTVNVLADRALDSVERLLLSIPPHKLGFAKRPKQASSDQDPKRTPEEAAKLEIENGTHQLETLLNASIDKNFDIFELYVMQNILTVRPQDQPYMRLSHYAGLEFPATAEEEDDDAATAQQSDKPTTESITALRRRLQASQKLNAVLESEKAHNEALLRRLRSLLGVDTDATKTEDDQQDTMDQDGVVATTKPFSFLRDRGGLEESGGEQPITTTTEFTLSQLQSLRALSGSLRKLLPELSLPGDDDAAAAAAASTTTASSPSWRRERAEYIESSSRKYLETVAGLELGPRGEVRDGEWQGEGRGLNKGEVEGLEKVAALLETGDQMDTR